SRATRSCSRGSASKQKSSRDPIARTSVLTSTPIKVTTQVKRESSALKAALSEVDRQHLRRRQRTIDSFPIEENRAEVIVEGQRLIDFCSNDYLGLARHPKVVAAMCEAAARTG